MIGIYKIISPTGKIYIGQSIHIEKRFKSYFYKGSNNKYQIKLYRSFIKYGVENHIFEIIEECNFEQLNIRERYWQDYYDVIGKNGLNCILTSTENLKQIMSQETKDKISKSNKGKKKPKFTECQLNKMSLAKLGIKHTDTHKNNLKNSLKNNKINDSKSKIILSMNTGVFYYCLTEASNIYKLKVSTLGAMLRGDNKNKTDLLYV